MMVVVRVVVSGGWELTLFWYHNLIQYNHQWIMRSVSNTYCDTISNPFFVTGWDSYKSQNFENRSTTFEMEPM